MKKKMTAIGGVAGAVLSAAVAAEAAGAAQWRNRYPHVAGYGHHVYLEGYELPVLTAGPMDPAPAPDGRRIAFSARGWIWIMDLDSRAARRLTRGGAMDFRPSWHPSGDRIAFVRDDGKDTWIVIADADSGEETAVIDTPALDLDPSWSADGTTLFYTSGQAGTLDVWALAIDEAEPAVQLTSESGIEMRPQPLPDGDGFLVLAKRGGDRVELRSAGGAPSRSLVTGNIASMARPALHPGGELFAINWPSNSGDGWELRVHSVARPESPVVLAESAGSAGSAGSGGAIGGSGIPLAPAWGPDGEWVYFAQADERENVGIRRVRAAGGPVERLDASAWEWGAGVARLRIRTQLAGRGQGQAGAARAATVPARISVVDASGHPAIPDDGAPHFDGSSGRVFFYSPGLLEVSVPVPLESEDGSTEAEVSAVQGLATPEARERVALRAGATTEIVLEMAPVWDARAAGWLSGDHHFHLNYGGPYDLVPSDITPKMRGEALDVATPLLANLHNRYEDKDLWGWQRSGEPPLIRFGQEIRSHFLGHIGLIEIPELHWPWVWGPGYEVYGSDDRTNAEVLSFGRRHGGIGYYVHPVGVADPFAEESRARVPVELVADAVLGDVDALEIVCLWSSFEGTAALWHRLLSVGVPVAPSAGTDVMLNLYRTMAVGVTRVYANTGGEVGWPAYLSALREGRSFVTNGPFLEFEVDGTGPGGVVAEGRTVSWSLRLATATEVDTVEVLANGRVIFAQPGLAESGARSYSGSVQLPSGGWIAARARGGETRWPSMDTSPFAHTGPVWIGARGSTDPEARRQAASELLAVLRASRARLVAGYGDTPIPRLAARFDEAMARLEELAAETGR